MNKRYQKNIFWQYRSQTYLLYLGLVFLFVLANSPRFALAYNTTAGSCNGAICASVIDDLPTNVTILNPNTTVNLNFVVSDSSNANNLNPCPSGKNIYHVLKHFSAADGSNYDYRSVANGPGFTYTFGSGTANQINYYTAIFYCDTGPAGSTSNSLIDTLLGRVTPQWTATFQKTAANSSTGGSTPSVLFSPQQSQYTAGTQINISVKNLPSNVGWYGMYVNQIPHQFMGQIGTSVPYPLNLTNAEGIKTDGSKNVVEIKALDANNNQISLQNDTLAFTVQAGAGTLANGTSCDDSPECKSNFCADNGNGTSSCQACSSDESCNSSGDTGFTCSSGVCVKPSAVAPPTGPAAPPVDCSGPNPNPNYCIYNPLPVDSLTATLLLIMRAFLGVIALFSAAFIVIGGFRYVISQGNEEAVTAARKTITWAIVGLAIALLSFSIIAIVQSILMTNVQPVSQSTGMVQEESIAG